MDIKVPPSGWLPESELRDAVAPQDAPPLPEASHVNGTQPTEEPHPQSLQEVVASELEGLPGPHRETLEKWILADPLIRELSSRSRKDDPHGS